MITLVAVTLTTFQGHMDIDDVKVLVLFFSLVSIFQGKNLPKKTTTTKTPLRFCQVQTHISLFPALNT